MLTVTWGTNGLPMDCSNQSLVCISKIHRRLGSIVIVGADDAAPPKGDPKAVRPRSRVKNFPFSKNACCPIISSPPHTGRSFTPGVPGHLLNESHPTMQNLSAPLKPDMRSHPHLHLPSHAGTQGQLQAQTKLFQAPNFFNLQLFAAALKSMLLRRKRLHLVWGAFLLGLCVSNSQTLLCSTYN